MKILFMGSAAFAVPSLDALVRSRHQVVEIVAQPDKPAGRGRHIHACPVAEFARSKGLALFQPTSVRKEESIEHFRSLAPDLLVIVAYGKILPIEIISIPPRGSINVHASLLPKYRGAAPINWAIANGEAETGVTTMFISEELDAGDILLASSTPIGNEESAGELHDRLACMGAALLMETIEGIENGELRAHPQDHSKATHAPILKKEDGHIDWKMPAAAIANRVRAFTPWPGTYTKIGDRTLRVHRAAVTQISHCGQPGTVIEARARLVIACGKGALCIDEVQIEGGRRMAAPDFLLGHKITVGTKFS